MKNNQEVLKQINDLASLQRHLYLQIIAVAALIIMVVTAWLPLTDKTQSLVITIELIVLFTVVPGVIIYGYSKFFKKKVALASYQSHKETIEYLKKEIERAPYYYDKDIKKTISNILKFDPEAKDIIKQWGIEWFEKLKKEAEETKAIVKKRLEKSDEEIVRILQMESEVDDLSDEGQEILLDFLSGIHNSLSDPKHAAVQLRPLLEQNALVYLRKNIKWYEERIRLVTEANKELAKFLKEYYGITV